MKSILKSELFKNKVYKKKYSKDFQTERLIENTLNVSSANATGHITELQLNGMHIVCKDIFAPNGYTIEAHSDFPSFVLHFEIAGNYNYITEGSKKPMIHIPDFHYNMFYLPYTDGLLKYSGAPRRTFEIIFTLELIKNIAGAHYKNTFAKIDNAIKNTKPFLFWKKPQPITPEISYLLEEIINCPYTEHLKKTYLQSKITILLVDILMHNEPKKPNKNTSTQIPQKDLESLTAVENYIKANLNKTLPISVLANIAGFNRSKLKRDFKIVYGTTIFKYITRLRMEKARVLISKEGFMISQAAHEVGYTNPQHFSYAFKRTLGYLPSVLKK